MSSESDLLLERINSLHRKYMRNAANAEGVQLVHLEILRYLSISNKYSNTAQALTDYLGQTKGSISQSLKFIEAAGHVERKPCEQDRRAMRIYLTSEGRACLKRMEKHLVSKLPDDSSSVETLKQFLLEWQSKNGFKGFGQCKTCRYNQSLDNNKFKCGLTGEALSRVDILKICQEHEFEEVLR